MFSTVFLVLASYLVTGSLALAPLTNNERANVIPGEYMVLLKPGSVGLSSATSASILQSFHIGDFRSLHVKASDTQVLSLRMDPNVQVVEANGWNFQAQCTAQDTGSRLWGLSRLSSKDLPGYHRATFNYDDENNGSGVTVYIADCGVYIEHNDFGGRASHGYTHPEADDGRPDDFHGHGTHVAGIVAGTEYGVAKGARLVSVKVLNGFGFGSTSMITAGMEWIARQHVTGSKSVVNASFGGQGESENVNGALNALINAGVVAVVSAGDGNGRACDFSPARVHAAITVAASTDSDELAASTNYGICCNVAAPGQGILSSDIGSPDAFEVRSGTSFAAPNVAGWAAKYMSSLDEAPSPEQVSEALLTTASKDKLYMTPEKQETPNFLPYYNCFDQNNDHV